MPQGMQEERQFNPRLKILMLYVVEYSFKVPTDLVKNID
jgi:hypothetical protein